MASFFCSRLWMYYIVLALSHLSFSTPRLSKRIAAAEAMEYELDDRRIHLVSEKGGEDDVWILKRRRKVEVWKALCVPPPPPFCLAFADG